MRILVATLLALGVLAAPAAARKPDLVVPSGSVTEQSGLLVGSFDVRNVGGRRAKPTAAGLFVKGDVAPFDLLPVKRLRPRHKRTVRVSIAIPSVLSPGSYPVLACADGAETVGEKSEDNNCRRVGRIFVAQGSTPAPTSQVPTDPKPFPADDVFKLDTYWIDVPSTYDTSHQTPMKLLVWLHGCGGQSQYDVANVSPGGSQDWISIAVDGRENDCWVPDEDVPKVLNAIASVETHFNIDRHRIIIGGYSSGGDLAYRTAFYNSTMFAGLLAENTSPFRDTGSTQAQSLAAATNKFHIVHLAHTEDETYPIDGVRTETDAVKAAGFPLTRVERPGTHYDADTDTTGTDHDVRTLLLPHIDDGWTSP